MDNTARTQHQTVFFFPFHFSATPENLAGLRERISDIPAAAILELTNLAEEHQSRYRKKHDRDPRDEAGLADAERRCRERLQKEPLWVREEYRSLSNDLHPYLRENYFGIGQKAHSDRARTDSGTWLPAWLNRLSMRRRTVSGRQPYLASWKLNRNCEDLHGKVSRESGARHDSLFSALFTIGLSPASRRRCDAESIRYSLDDARLHLFQTGIAFIELTVRFVLDEEALALDAQLRLVQEGNYALSHPQHARDRAGEPSGRTLLPALATFFISSLASSSQRARIERDEWTRIYSYTAIVTDSVRGIPEELSLDMVRIARHYTTDYRITAADGDPESLVRYEPFDNQLHFACIEGGASLVGYADETEHQKQWIPNSFRPLYLPIVLLDLHNHTEMVEIIQKRRVSFAPRKEANSDALIQLLGRLSDFRLNYLFHEASQISLHNDFHKMLDVAFRVDAMCERLTLIIADAREFLGIAQEYAQEKRTRTLTLISSAVGGGFVCKEISEVLAERNVINPYEWQYLVTVQKEARPEVIQPILLEAERWEMISVSAFFGGAIIAWAVARTLGTKGRPG